MRSVSNSIIERKYFEQFRTHFPLPQGDVEYTDKPDVVLKGDRRVGIEIAHVHLTDGKDPASEQVQMERRKVVLKLAQQQFLATGGRRIELTFSFDPSHPIADAKAVAKELATAAVGIADGPAGEVPRAMYAELPQIAFVYHNPREYPDAKWRVAQSYTTPYLAVGRVIELIESKHGKIADYKPCDAFWLLLIVDFFDRAQDQDIRWPETAMPVSSKFERIIIYKPQFGEWTEVPIIVEGKAHDRRRI